MSRRNYTHGDIVVMVLAVVVGIIVFYFALQPPSPEDIRIQKLMESSCEKLSLEKDATRFEVVGDPYCVLYFCEQYEIDGISFEKDCRRERFKIEEVE